MPPKISVIIPVYNVEKYLPTCLDSVLNQTFRDIEVILVDDSSTDNSFSICKKYSIHDNRIRLYQQKNKGPGIARNRGIRLARGEYLSFLDSDDFFELDMLENLYEKAISYNADFIFCRHWRYNMNTGMDLAFEDINTKYLPCSDVFSCDDILTDNIFSLCYSGPWNKLVKKEFIIKNHLFFLHTRRSEDIVFNNLCFALAPRIVFVNKRYIHYRFMRDGSLSKNADKHETIKAYSFFKNYLCKKGLYQKFKNAYKKRCSDVFNNYVLNSPLSLSSQNIDSFFNLNILPLLNEKKSFIQDNFDNTQNSITIVMSFDNDYLTCALVTIYSLIEHTDKNKRYCIYILHDNNFSEYSITQLKKLSNQNVTIVCTNIQNKISKWSFFTRAHYTQQMYYRLFIPELFSNHKKIIYLDADTIIQQDISLLLNLHLGNNLIAGVLDHGPTNGINPCSYLKKYVNSGVLVFNIKKCIQYNFCNKVTDILSKRLELLYPDQDIINILCDGKIKLLSPKWNLLYHQYFSKKLLLKQYQKLCKKEGIKSLKDAFILHYSGDQKPWNTPFKIGMGIWWQYAQKMNFLLPQKAKIKLLFDITQTSTTENGSGIIKTTDNLFHKLANHAEIDLYPLTYLSEEKAMLYLNKMNTSHLKSKLIKLPSFFKSTSITSLMDYYAWKHKAKKLLPEIENLISSFDAYFSVFHPIPAVFENFNFKRFLIVHDLIPMIMPQEYIPDFRKAYHLWFKHPADCYISISKNTKNDLIKVCPWTRKMQLPVINWGTDHNLFYPASQSQIDKIKRKYGISSPKYILGCSTFTMRKNFIHLIQSFIYFLDKTNIEDVSLVLVGNKRIDYLEDHMFISNLEKKYKEKIICTGYVDDKDLAPLYTGSLCFIYPSLYEGFGLPILEAMCCGTPVITCNNSSLPEVGGNAALYVSGKDPKETSQWIEKIYIDPIFGKRLVIKGIQNSKRFSWEKCIDDLVNIIKTTISKS